MKWITRSNVKVDRIACPWLLRRFVDRSAEFLFVEEAQLLEAAAREQAAPEGLGLRAIAEGFATLGIPDEERLAQQFPVYDALYRYAQLRER